MNVSLLSKIFTLKYTWCKVPFDYWAMVRKGSGSEIIVYILKGSVHGHYWAWCWATGMDQRVCCPPSCFTGSTHQLREIDMVLKIVVLLKTIIDVLGDFNIHAMSHTFSLLKHQSRWHMSEENQGLKILIKMVFPTSHLPLGYLTTTTGCSTHLFEVAASVLVGDWTAGQDSSPFPNILNQWILF